MIRTLTSPLQKGTQLFIKHPIASSLLSDWNWSWCQCCAYKQTTIGVLVTWICIRKTFELLLPIFLIMSIRKFDYKCINVAKTTTWTMDSKIRPHTVAYDVYVYSSIQYFLTQKYFTETNNVFWIQKNNHIRTSLGLSRSGRISGLVLITDIKKA